MIANPSAVDLIVRVLFLFGYALLFALAEIEIEGEHGRARGCSASSWAANR
jgi:hypothetical protein